MKKNCDFTHSVSVGLYLHLSSTSRVYHQLMLQHECKRDSWQHHVKKCSNVCASQCWPISLSTRFIVTHCDWCVLLYRCPVSISRCAVLGTLMKTRHKSTKLKSLFQVLEANLTLSGITRILRKSLLNPS